MKNFIVKINERGGGKRSMTVIATNWFAAWRVGCATMTQTGSIVVRLA